MFRGSHKAWRCAPGRPYQRDDVVGDVVGWLLAGDQGPRGAQGLPEPEQHEKHNCQFRQGQRA